ncbi:LysR substrate-binding domain-containing protein [Rhizobium lusitanum]|uniref:LysR family glycine cleavage system transcriptional activator n=1 Tax=Rhizobium lusitanum TaxID=293958 RepID=A0A7X0IT01_9HYPH|nr:LysR substrate-binding domain-containing protein [Rhizobium lusitanum]MBB6486618.1 LysR family glycine cleavage system transcriptional activator [Rhizobium lusitanum]
MRHIPYASLRAFEAALRHESFARAATELNLTAAGVSQHVKIVENWLGVALFTRHARGVTATAAGREFGAAVTSGLGQIESAAQKLAGTRHDRPVSIACIASVATRWLIPRLPKFREEHPDIRINIVYALDAKTPEAASVDLLIRHGIQPSANSTALLSGETRPTCSAEYRRRHGPIETPAKLLDLELLHDETPASWARWFADTGIGTPLRPGPVFADFSLMIGSIVGSQGIGLCPGALIVEELANGTLVTLFESPLDTDKFYWLIEADHLSRQAETLRDWLVAESCRSQSGHHS